MNKVGVIKLTLDWPIMKKDLLPWQIGMIVVVLAVFFFTKSIFPTEIYFPALFAFFTSLGIFLFSATFDYEYLAASAATAFFATALMVDAPHYVWVLRITFAAVGVLFAFIYIKEGILRELEISSLSAFFSHIIEAGIILFIIYYFS